MNESNASSLAIKVLLISHVLILIKYNIKLSLIVLIITFIILAFSKYSIYIDHKLNEGVNFLGRTLLKVILTVFYFLIVTPLSVFKKKQNDTSSTYIEPDTDEINFERPW